MSTIADERQQAPSEKHTIRGALIIGLTLIAAVAVALLVPDAYRQPVTLGIVQGISEFLPISSSAHLIVVPELLGWQSEGLTFDVALHAGTLLAVIGYFWRDWVRLLLAAPKPASPDGRLFWYLVMATFPAGLAGLLFEDIIETTLRDPAIIVVTLAVVGVLLWLVDRRAPQEKTLHEVSRKDALLVGVAQALALIPGTSRSGITMTAGRLRGMTRETAARFSFLLSTPVTAGATIFKLKDLEPGMLDGPFIAGVLTSAVVGVLTIGLLLQLVRRAGFGIYAIYRVLFALLLLWVVVL